MPMLSRTSGTHGAATQQEHAAVVCTLEPSAYIVVFAAKAEPTPAPHRANVQLASSRCFRLNHKVE